MRKVCFSVEQIQDICKQYTEDHISMRKIGIEYQVSKTVISRVLEECKIEKRSDNHTYKADYRKFKDIDSSEKAYWLGFIAADGCVYKRKTNGTVYISIHEKDIQHLEKFKSFMKSNVPIKKFISDTGFSNPDNPTPMCKISYNSMVMVNDMISHGIVPNKSLKLGIPNIPEKFYLPYILGYFDGDGSIYKVGTEYGIAFIGTKENMNWINTVLDMNAKLGQRKTGSDTYYIKCGGIQKPYTILKRLYDSTYFHLERKYKIYQELEQVVLSRNTKRLSGRELLETPQSF